MSKVALIVGCSGQDGSYLAEFLLAKGYEVFGIIRRSSTSNTERIDHIKEKITLLPADITDQSSIIRAIQKAKPRELYNLAAQSFVHESWNQVEFTSDVNALGVARILEAIRFVDPTIRFYQASTSEMFGKVCETPQTEKTPFHPRSPYGVSKVYGHWITINYRESYNIFACSGILYNHESPRRGLEFVTRKISNAAARIKLGLQQELRLGNLEAKRDWGASPDYVEAMWLMLQQDVPDDFVIATGEQHSVKEFCKIAFDHVGLNWQDHVKTDDTLKRPAEVDSLLGDYSKAKKKLNWRPRTSFNTLVKTMVDADLSRYCINDINNVGEPGRAGL